MSLEFGKKIAALRKMQGVTQVQLADYLMVQPQTISRWESEGGTPDVMLLPKIATFFNITMELIKKASITENLSSSQLYTSFPKV